MCFMVGSTFPWAASAGTRRRASLFARRAPAPNAAASQSPKPGPAARLPVCRPIRPGVCASRAPRRAISGAFSGGPRFARRLFVRRHCQEKFNPFKTRQRRQARTGLRCPSSSLGARACWPRAFIQRLGRIQQQPLVGMVIVRGMAGSAGRISKLPAFPGQEFPGRPLPP